jgi:enterobacterial common antigen flippase
MAIRPPRHPGNPTFAKSVSQKEYKSIVGASFLSGSASIVSILANFGRTKVIAVFAGTEGVGLLGLYTSTLNLVSAASSLGLGSSAVRDIAVHAGADNAEKVSGAIQALRRLAWITGALGAIGCFAAAPQISAWTFGSEIHGDAIRILSVCILLIQLSASQAALLRGLRKIKELAVQSIAISVVTFGLAAAMFGPWGIDAIVPFMIATHIMTLAGTWWFARRVKVDNQPQSLGETFSLGKSMISLGMAFQASALISAVTTHLIGIIVHGVGGSELNGLYQAAWGSTGALASLVLGAMGKDFYPRLATVSDDGPASMRLIGQQTEIAILLSLPLLAGFVATATVLVPLLFSSEFAGAVPAVGWFALGAFGRVISWPLGYYLIAAGRGVYFFATELVFGLIYLLLAHWLIELRGLQGIGMAWFALYLLYWLTMTLLVGRLCRQPVGRSALRHSCMGLAALGAAHFMGVIWGLLFSVLLAIICLRSLIRRVGRDNRISLLLTKLPLLGKFLSS